MTLITQAKAMEILKGRDVVALMYDSLTGISGPIQKVTEEQWKEAIESVTAIALDDEAFPMMQLFKDSELYCSLVWRN